MAELLNLAASATGRSTANQLFALEVIFLKKGGSVVISRLRWFSLIACMCFCWRLEYSGTGEL